MSNKEKTEQPTSNRSNNEKLIVIRRCIFALKFVGSPNWYQGIDKPTFAEWLYKWRIGWGTAWQLAKIRYDGNGLEFGNRQPVTKVQ
jgi:hypothetical protein